MFPYIKYKYAEHILFETYHTHNFHFSFSFSFARGLLRNVPSTNVLIQKMQMNVSTLIKVMFSLLCGACVCECVFVFSTLSSLFLSGIQYIQYKTAKHNHFHSDDDIYTGFTG